jgi:hypothetical protein
MWVECFTVGFVPELCLNFLRKFIYIKMSQKNELENDLHIFLNFKI